MAELLQYAAHYLNWQQALPYLGLNAVIITLELLVIVMYVNAKSRSVPEREQRRFRDAKLTLYSERLYELVFAGASILLFVAVYFLIDHFGIAPAYQQIWDKYSSFILLAFLLFSVLFNDLLDHAFVPLHHVSARARAAGRLSAMIYMSIIFIYIKFIYEDSNYDSIIVYFIGMVIGRFVYFDASMEGFTDAIKDTGAFMGPLGLVLAGTAVSAWIGFGSGYLLRSNGVVMSLFIMHMFMSVVICILARSHFLRLFMGRGRRTAGRREVRTQE